MINMRYIEETLELLTSGGLAQQFECSPEERRYEILDFLEKLMELGEAADAAATTIIFKNSYLGMLAGAPDESTDKDQK